MTFKRVVAHSGLAKTELATLYGTTRQTIHNWTFVGPPREGTLFARQAEAITQALCTAMDKGLLPLKLSNLTSPQKEMWKARVKRMARTLANLKPVPVKS